MGVAIFDRDVSALDKTGLAKTAPKRRHQMRRIFGRRDPQESDHGHCGLLRLRRKRPRGRTAEQRDERAALHSITSSARIRNESGMANPSALAVVRLTTRSNLVGCSTGISAGFTLRRI